MESVSFWKTHNAPGVAGSLYPLPYKLNKRCDGRSRSPSPRLPPSCPQTCLLTSFVRHQGGCRCRVLLEQKGTQIRNLPVSNCPPSGLLAYPTHFFQRRIAKL